MMASAMRYAIEVRWMHDELDLLRSGERKAEAEGETEGKAAP